MNHIILIIDKSVIVKQVDNFWNIENRIVTDDMI